MEKVQTLLLILFGLVALVWRLVQKARETAAQESRERPTGQGPPLPTTSFQELLKQMQAQNSRPADPTATDTVPAREQYPSRPAESGPLAARLPERAAPGRRAPKPSDAEPAADQSGSAPRTVRERLRTPADLRAAFVLSEILKRKFE